MFAITVEQTHPVKEEDVRRLMRQYLEEKIIRGRWIENTRVMEEHVTSHRFDADITKDLKPAERELLGAALILRDHLRDKK